VSNVNSSETPVLSVRNLSITAGDRVVQRGVTVDLRAGELVAVTGPSGSGKTTFLRTVVGLQDAAEGSIVLRDRPAAAWGWPSYRRKVLLVSQQPALFDATVEENLRRPFTYQASKGSAFPRERAVELLEELGVGADRIDQDASTLSVGQKQRVSLIRALLLMPDVLCLDEPTSALDVDSVALVQNVISAEAASRGLAALIVTHSVEQAEHWCHRKIVLPAATHPDA
jgi:putative ABC transport system ATP-binding protein